MTDFGALGEAYRDLTEIERTRLGVRYAATLADGSTVTALAIAPDVAGRISSPDAFAAELQRAAAVHHEAIVPLLAWGNLSDGTLHCAYARSERDELVAGSLPPAAVAGIGERLARALTAAHASGVAHGAIATGRIVLTRDRGAQLGDFGLFAALSTGGLGVQATSTLLGDPAYVSPEVQLGKPPDERADIYSLGASLYELLTGKPPYGGRTTTYVLASVLSDGDVAESAETANPVVDALVRAIERAPEDRWPNAAAFAAALAAGIPAQQPVQPVTKGRRGCLPAAAVLTLGSLGILLASR